MSQGIRGKVEHKDVDRDFDKSTLQNASYDGRVDRDVLGHHMRWSFAQRYIKQGMDVLDVGCGPRPHLPKLLCPHLSFVPNRYVGVDINRIQPIHNYSWVEYHSKYDATKRNSLKKLGAFDMIINLEVYEHMKPAFGLKLLTEIHAALKSDGVFWFSTPVFDGKKARNHIKEYTVKEMQKILERKGFYVEARYGVFASWPVIKKVITPEELDFAESLMPYHCHATLACYFAAKYPDSSRNNAWVLRKSAGLRAIHLRGSK